MGRTGVFLIFALKTIYLPKCELQKPSLKLYSSVHFKVHLASCCIYEYVVYVCLIAQIRS